MTNQYESPLASRYASDEMLYLFSPDKKFSTWRKLWIALARAEKALGLAITDEQIAEMEAHVYDIDYAYAAEMEKSLRHDVMAHVHAFGKAAPSAMPIIHLGATSCYVGDNTDIILMREGLELIRAGLVNVIALLAAFADRYKDLPTLGFTHFQPAQLTTVGKRASLWLNDFLSELEEVDHRIGTLRLLGSKGTTGTQASFMELFDGDQDKIRRLETMIAEEMGFEHVVPSPGRPTPARQIIRSSPSSPASRSPRANSPRTSACSRISRRSKSRPRASRSAPPPCPTSAIPCAASASARWRAT